jgi:hypothetical protein
MLCFGAGDSTTIGVDLVMPLNKINRLRGSSGVIFRSVSTSNGYLRKVVNPDQTILARERGRSIATLSLRDAENPVMAGVVDRDGAAVVLPQKVRPAILYE